MALALNNLKKRVDMPLNKETCILNIYDMVWLGFMAYQSIKWFQVLQTLIVLFAHRQMVLSIAI